MNQYDSEAVMFDPQDAVLVLEDGQVYVGEPYGAIGTTSGEIVFATRYDRISGNAYGPQLRSSDRGADVPAHWGHGNQWGGSRILTNLGCRLCCARSQPECEQLACHRHCDDLESNHIVGISRIDTRKLVRHLRSAGVMRAGIFSGDALLDANGKLRTIESMLDEVKSTPQMKGMSLYDEVSTKEAYTIEPCGEFAGKEPLFTVAAVDLGIKAMTPHRMAERGCRVHVVPSTITFDELEALNPDGVFFSNGPGDPEQADPEVNLLRQVLDAGHPFFGICFGNQLLGRALGFGTYKLKFGHRGINQPVKDMTTGKIEITAHNHGFAVDAPIGETVDAPFENGKYGKVFVSHIDLNDNVVEGLQCVDIPAFSVQYHPEAAAGPHDAAYLFDRFVDLMRSAKEGTRNA